MSEQESTQSHEMRQEINSMKEQIAEMMGMMKEMYKAKGVAETSQSHNSTPIPYKEATLCPLEIILYIQISN